METIEALPQLLVSACILVTLAFLMTRARLLPDLLKPRMSLRDQVVIALLFVGMGTAEVLVPDASYMNLRIVAVAAAGLLGGRWVGLFIGIVITYLAAEFAAPKGMPVPIGVSMILGGLAAGWVHDFRPTFSFRPLAGFLVGAGVSGFRDLMNFFLDHSKTTTLLGGVEAAALQGLSVALILLVIEQARSQESQARATAMAEVRALQARMNPHFLFNSLNTLSALSEIDPAAVPQAAAQLGKFLRASIDLPEQQFVTLRQEMEVVDAYLEVEALRLRDRLVVSKDVDPSVLEARVPPFLVQPLVENAVRHGIHPLTKGGTVTISAKGNGARLVVTVMDDGVGMGEVERSRVYESSDGHAHALSLIRRRLVGLYGSKFEALVESRLGEGAKFTVSIPLDVVAPSHGQDTSTRVPGVGAGVVQGGSV